MALSPPPGSSTVDRSWTRFVRGWRDLMRTLFLPRCSRTEPCCEFECPDAATHFKRTGALPQKQMWQLFALSCWYCGAVDPSKCGCPSTEPHP